MKHSAMTVGEGKQPYSSPALELLEIRSEQGFAATGDWNSALNYEPLFGQNDGFTDFE